jgi:hypothetical protein
MKLVRIIGFVALAAAGFFIWRWIVMNQPLRFGANETPQTQSLGVIAYGYAVTVAGVLIGSFYRALQAMKEAGTTSIGDPGKFVKTVLLSVDLWLSLFGSPIVYALLWKSLDGGNIAGLTVIALENGFCCTMVVNNFMKKGPEQNPNPPIPAPRQP